MTADESALWRAVLDRPDDDLARLVYADCVEESGRGALAGFIRAQIRLANAPPGHADYPDAVEAQSVAVAAARGASSLPAPVLPDGVRFSGDIRTADRDGYGAYERGFPAAAVVDGHRLRTTVAVSEAVGRVLAETTVRGLGFLYTSDPAVRSALLNPAAGRLAGLDLHGEAAGALFDSPTAARLTRLALADNAAAEGSRRLATSAMPRLARLEVGRAAGSGPTAAVQFARAAWLPNLIHLDAHHRANGLRLLDGAGALHSLTVRGLRGAPVADLTRARPRGFAHLRELALVSAELTGESGRALARWPLPPVASFRLTDATVTADGLAALLAAPWLAGCVELAVTNSRTPPLAEPLAAASFAGSLRHLTLDGTVTDADDLVALARPGGFPALSTLSVKRSSGTDPSGFTGFAEAWSGTALHTLALDGWPVRAAGLQRLAANPVFASLRRLKLSHSKVPDAGAAHLFASPHLANLAELDAAHNTLSGRAAAALLAGALPGLALADLTTNRMHPDDRTRLRAARPGVWA